MSSIKWNSNSFEKTLSKNHHTDESIISKFSNQSTYQPNSIFNSFFIFGIPPDKIQNNPVLLFAYPLKEITDINYIIDFVFPYEIQKAEKNQNHIQNEFSFCLRDGVREVYGCCAYISCLSSSKIPFFVTSNNLSWVFGFCLITEIPCLSIHFTFLNYLIFRLFGNIDDIHQCPMIQTDQETVQETDKSHENTNSIEGLEVNGDFGIYHSLQAEPWFMNEIIFFHNMTIPSPPIIYSQNFELHFPSEITESSILWSTLDCLFSHLSLDHVLCLLCAALLDSQILISGSNIHDVTFCVLALSHMLHPFKFVGSIIPILPKKMFNLLQSPSPFIIGVLSSVFFDDIEFDEKTIFVNIDKNTLKGNNHLPLFPQFARVSSELRTLLSKTTSKVSNPFMFPHYIQLKQSFYFSPFIINQIISIIQKPFQNLFSDMSDAFFVTDISNGKESTLFNSDLFIATVPLESFDFFKEFVHCQSFHFYLDKRLYSYLVHKKSSNLK